MALKIQTTGLDQFAPGGKARLKIMFVAGPGAGKTRISSFWPKPIYADCERGLSSVADRRVPFVEINNSNQMLEFLADLKRECQRPWDERRFQTVVIDTVDAFQRKVKDEWLLANPSAQSFRGFDAWGYLDTKMQALLTRLLNLDMNIILNVHPTTKTVKEGSGESETSRDVIELQLSGAVKDTIFNDFDLVGWIGTYWASEGGERVQKRGLTFKPTPEKSFLKDRLHITPTWMEVKFSDEDYATLFAAFTSRLDEFAETETIGEIASLEPEAPTSELVEPPRGGGALPEQPQREVPLSQHDKPTLMQMARKMGITTTLDGQPLKTNTLKSELVDAIEAKKLADSRPTEPPAAEPTAPAADAAPTDVQPQPDAAPAPAPAEPEPAPAPTPEPAPEPTPEPAAEPAVTTAEGVPGGTAGSDAAATPAPEPVEAAVEQTEVGAVDTTTGEITEPVMSVEEVAQALDATVVSEEPVAEAAPAPEPTPEPAPEPVAQPSAAGVCEQCGKSLAGENQDYVKLAFIKFRKKLCNDDYAAAKKAG